MSLALLKGQQHRSLNSLGSLLLRQRAFRALTRAAPAQQQGCAAARRRHSVYRAGRAGGAVRAWAMVATAEATDFPILVSPEWLKDRLGQVKVLDATWYMPNAGRDAGEEFKAERIKGAQYFDLDTIANTSTGLPHMLPSERQFAAAADTLGITNNDAVVIYDNSGIFSAPRGWWTWKMLGHERVAVLDGGLPAWKAIRGPLDTSPVEDATLQGPGKAAQNPPETTAYRAHLVAKDVRSWKEILENVTSKKELVVDARPSGRWRGEVPEPRPGLQSGHIPRSISLPFVEVLENGRFKSPEQLRGVLEGAGVDLSQPLVVSCGSGTTACVLVLAAQLAVPGKEVAVYDGSWTEWAQLPGVPIGKAAGNGSSSA